MASAEKGLISDIDKLLVVLGIIGASWLIYQLSAVLTPFFIAALLAYLGDPLVNRLQRFKKLSRSSAVLIVFALLLLIVGSMVFVLLPLLGAQLSAFLQRFPEYLAQLQLLLEPWLAMAGLSDNVLDAGTIKQTLSNYWSELTSVAGELFNYLTRSGMLLFQWLMNLVLVPVLTFYLLRDWDAIIGKLGRLVPKRHQARVNRLASECDEVLSSFLRGQLMVMLALSVIYCLGLSLIGLELALLLGVIAGVVSFVPYLGLIVGVLLAGLAAFFQFQEWLPLLMVFAVFAVAQLLEAMILTPRFVGNRIGLHPVAVIFAVLAGGQLFGFIGVLLALPVAAIAMVMLRHLHARYTRSQLYS